MVSQKKDNSSMFFAVAVVFGIFALVFVYFVFFDSGSAGESVGDVATSTKKAVTYDNLTDKQKEKIYEIPEAVFDGSISATAAEIGIPVYEGEVGEVRYGIVLSTKSDPEFISDTTGLKLREFEDDTYLAKATSKQIIRVAQLDSVSRVGGYEGNTLPEKQENSPDLSKSEMDKLGSKLQHVFDKSRPSFGEIFTEKNQDGETVYPVYIKTDKPESLEQFGINVGSPAFDNIFTARLTKSEIKKVLKIDSVLQIRQGQKLEPLR